MFHIWIGKIKTELAEQSNSRIKIEHYPINAFRQYGFLGRSSSRSLNLVSQKLAMEVSSGIAAYTTQIFNRFIETNSFTFSNQLVCIRIEKLYFLNF